MFGQDPGSLDVGDKSAELFGRWVGPCGGMVARGVECFEVVQALYPVVLNQRDRAREHVQLVEVADFDGAPGDALDGEARGIRVQPRPARPEHGLQVLLAGVEAEPLASDAVVGVLGEAVYPVGPGCLGGVVGNLDPEDFQDVSELRLGVRERAGYAHPAPDVGRPRVLAPAGELDLRAPDVLGLQALRLAPRGMGRALARLPIVAQEVQPALLGKILQRMVEASWVGVLQAPAVDDVGVVDDDVRMGDAAGVVVVVDDGNLGFAEVPLCPCHRQLAKLRQGDGVSGVGRDDVVLVGACALSAPWLVVADAAPRGVHDTGPVEHGCGIGYVGVLQVDVVARERPALLGQVAVGPPARSVPGYRLEYRHRRRLDARDVAPGQEPRLAPERGGSVVHGLQPAVGDVELLQHVEGVHLVEAEVVGDDVERMHGLVVVVAPAVELAVDAHRGDAVDDDDPRIRIVR